MRKGNGYIYKIVGAIISKVTHTPQTATLTDHADIESNYKNVRRFHIWLPDKILKDRAETYLTQVYELLGGKISFAELNFVKYYNMMTKYTTLIILAEYDSEAAKKIYKEETGEDWDKAKAVKYFNNAYNSAYRNYLQERAIIKKKKQTTTANFWDIVSGVETVMGFSIPETTKIVKFASLYRLAAKKSEMLETKMQKNEL